MLCPPTPLRVKSPHSPISLPTRQPQVVSWRYEEPTCLPVLLHAVAAVVELGEGGGELVQVVAERVEQQVVQDLLQDLREAQDALPQLPLLLVVQEDLRGLRRSPQRGLVDVGQASYGPTGSAAGVS